MFKSIKIDKKYIKNLFPIHSQTSEEDKIFLLNTIKFLKGKNPFKYVLGNTKNKIVRKLNESIS